MEPFLDPQRRASTSGSSALCPPLSLIPLNMQYFSHVFMTSSTTWKAEEQYPWLICIAISRTVPGHCREVLNKYFWVGE